MIRRISGVGACAAVAGSALLFSVGTAEAEGQNFSVQQSSGPTQTLQFLPFDTLLGTLTEVDIVLSDPATSLGSMVNITGGEGTATTSFSADLNIDGPDASALFQGTAGASASCNSFAGGNCPQSSTATFNGLTPASVALTSNLSLWEGPSDVGVKVAIENFSPSQSCIPGPGAKCDFTNDLKWTGTVTVTYQYDAANIPEPASAFAMGVGLLCLALTRRRILQPPMALSIVSASRD